MSEIKSALEIALERTNNVQSDRTQIVKNDSIEEGRRAAFEFLEDAEKKFSFIEEKIKTSQKDRVDWVREGMLKVFLSNLKLPDNEAVTDIIYKLRDGITAATGRKKDVAYIFSQLETLFKQYIQNKKDVVENLKTNYSKKLREKEAAMSKQLGSPVHLEPERDPEYLDYLHKAVNQLDKQYQQIIIQIKEELLKKN